MLYWRAPEQTVRSRSSRQVVSWPDSTLPKQTSIVVDGDTITVTYNKRMVYAGDDAKALVSAYTVKVNGVERPVTSARLDINKVILKLSSPVTSSNAVTLSFHP